MRFSEFSQNWSYWNLYVLNMHTNCCISDIHPCLSTRPILPVSVHLADVTLKLGKHALAIDGAAEALKEVVEEFRGRAKG